MSTLSGTIGIHDDTEMQVTDGRSGTPVVALADWSLMLVIESPVKARRLATLLNTAADLKDAKDRNRHE